MDVAAINATRPDGLRKRSNTTIVLPASGNVTQDQNGSSVAMTVKTARMNKSRPTNGRTVCRQAANVPRPSIRAVSISETGIWVADFQKTTRLNPQTSQLPNHNAYAPA